MAESIKDKMDRFFGVNSSSVEPLPNREISLDEMLQYREESKVKLKNRDKISKGKRSSGIAGDLDNPCPKCGISKWDQFPDGRLYCLKCGAVKEVDGTIIGGAIMKEITNGGEKTIIDGELRCELCGKTKPFSCTMEELNEFIKQPHKNCGGMISFSIIKQASKDNEIKPVVDAAKQNIESTKFYKKSDRCDNPKRDIFICNNCRDFNYCTQKNVDAVICLLISIDLKLKKLLGRWPQ